MNKKKFKIKKWLSLEDNILNQRKKIIMFWLNFLKKIKISINKRKKYLIYKNFVINYKIPLNSKYFNY